MIIERHRWMRPRTMTTTTNEWEWEERRWITVRVTGENETNRIGRWQLMATAQLITKKGTKLVGFLSPVLRHWRITHNSNLTPYKVNNKHGPPPPTPPAPNWLIGWTDPPPLPPPLPPRWTRLLRFLLRHQFGSIHRHKRQSFTSSAINLTHLVANLFYLLHQSDQQRRERRERRERRRSSVLGNSNAINLLLQRCKIYSSRWFHPIDIRFWRLFRWRQRQKLFHQTSFLSVFLFRAHSSASSCSTVPTGTPQDSRWDGRFFRWFPWFSVEHSNNNKKKKKRGSMTWTFSSVVTRPYKKALEQSIKVSSSSSIHLADSSTIHSSSRCFTTVGSNSMALGDIQLTGNFQVNSGNGVVFYVYLLLLNPSVKYRDVFLLDINNNSNRMPRCSHWSFGSVQSSLGCPLGCPLGCCYDVKGSTTGSNRWRLG